MAMELSSESVTLTTYYPAPSGVYQQMITTGKTHLARDGNDVHVFVNAPGGSEMKMYAHKITGGPTTAASITAAGDFATKAYVDAAAGGPTGWTCTVRSGAAGASSSIACSGAEKVITGGCSVTDYSIGTQGRPSGQGWTCNSTAGNTVTAWANCCL